MTKILGVIGATGQQGRAVIDFVQSDPELSKEYIIRAITRDIHSKKSKELASLDIEVVTGDTENQASLSKALAGVHTLFAMTIVPRGADAVNVEFQNANLIADTAVDQQVQYLIYSSLPDVVKISQGKWMHATHFNFNAKAERYIRDLTSIKSSFVQPGAFMQNLSHMPLVQPKKMDDGTYVLSLHLKPEQRLAWIDITEDLGKIVGIILADPAEHAGKDIAAAVQNYTYQEVADAMTRATGKHVAYKQMATNDFRALVPSAAADTFEAVFSYAAEFGYYGEDTEQRIKWSASNARGKLRTLDDYCKAHPLELP